MSLERFVSALEGAGVWHRVTGDRVTFRCPLPEHEDATASAGADWRAADSRSATGRVLLLCRVCGRSRTADVIAALGLTDVDLFDDVPTRPDSSSPRARRGPSRPSGQRSIHPRSSAAPAAARGDKSTPPPARVPTTATPYLFHDQAGQVVARLTRFDPVDPTAEGARKGFKWEHRGGPRGGWARGKPDGGAPLYRLPAVLAAVASGARVWVVEGCKNADDLAGLVPAGEVVTTPPDGAGAGWPEAHTAALAGGTVVVVADRDAPGYRHAGVVATALRAAGAAVRVVRTPLESEHADASDHIAAGFDLAAFEDVPAAVLGLPAVDPSEQAVDTEEGPDATVTPIRPARQDSTRRGGGGGGGGGDEGGAGRDAWADDEYGTAREVGRDVDALVKITHRRVGRELRVVLDCDVRVVRRLHRDPGDGTAAGTTHVDLEATRDGQTVELLGVEWDDFRGCKFLARLPWLSTFRDTPQGRSDVIAAILTRSGPVPVVPTYGHLGWWETTPGEWVYCHADGGIGKSGPVPGVQTAVSPRLSGFTLPAPPESPETIAAALDGVTAVLELLPARVAAPVMGAPLRAMLGEARTSVFVVGYTGSRKSGLAALAQQMHYPAARHSRLPVGAGEGAVTATAMEHLMWEAAHTLLVADDLAPDRGAERSSARANELLRMAGNGTAKGRGARVGGLREDRPPQTLLLVTGEDGASRLSAESRTVYVPLTPADPGDPDSGDAPLGTIRELSTRERIAGRNATASVLARWLAGRMPVAEWVDASRDELSAALLAECSHLDSDGLMPRRADAVAELATGWRALLEMARDTGALSGERCAALWSRVWAGLVEALVRQTEVSDRRAMVEHASDLLRSAVTSGAAHLAGPDGETPAADLSHACGWERVGLADFRSVGRAVGWTDGTRVWLDPGATFAAIESQGAAQRDPLGVTPRALTAALTASRLLATEMQDGRRTPTPQVRRRLAGQRRRVWDLPWSWLWPDGADPDGTPADPAPAPTPTAPDLFGPPPPATPSADDVEHQAAEEDEHAPADEAPAAGAERPADAATAPAPPSAPARAVRRSEGRSRPAETARTGYTATAVVVDVDGAWLSSTGAVEHPEFATLADLLSWADGLGLGTRHERSRDDAGQVWIMPALARRLGLRGKRPPKDSGRTAVARTLTDAGWRLGRAGLSDWTHCYREGRPSLWLVAVPWLTESEMCSPTDPPTGSVLAERIELFRELLNAPWLLSAGATGTELMKLHQATARKRVTGEPIEQPPPAMEGRCNAAEREWSWRRAVSADEAAGADRVVQLDVNAQYLAAASVAELGIGDPEQVTDPDRLARLVADPRRLPPGYWLITRPETSAGVPDLLDPVPFEHPAPEQTWVTTPSLRAVLEAGYGLDVPTQAWVWPDHTRWLQTWAEGLRDARYFLADALDGGVDPDGNLAAVQSVVKVTYAAGIGMLGSLRWRGPSKDRPCGTWDFRPDARHHVVATAKANLWRKVRSAAEKDGRVPVAITRDAVVYLAGPADPDVPAGFREGTKLGTVKIEKTFSVSDGIEKFAAVTPES